MGFFTWHRRVATLLIAIRDNLVNLNKGVSNMATKADVDAAVAAVKISADAVIAKIEELKAQIGNGIDPATLDQDVADLNAIKATLDTAAQ